MRTRWAALMAAGMSAVAPQVRQGGGEQLAVSAVRFYSPGTGTTTIEVVCELAVGAMASGSGDTVSYRMSVSVQDSTGLELTKGEWQRSLPRAVATARGASSVETYGFPAAPGRYRVVVQAIPATGSPVERAMDVSAFAARPRASDLLVASAARLAGAEGSAAGAGEIQRGSLILRTAPVPRFSPGATALSYYAEIYPWPGAAQDGEFRVAILGAGGRRTVQTSPRPVHVSAAGGASRWSLDLTGLPPGAYVLQWRLALGDSTVVAEAPFAMGAGTADSTVAAAAATEPATDVFANASEATLDSLYAPLVYIAQPDDGGVYRQLAVDGKRRYLSEFWARRDPTHGTGTNTAMVQFYRAVAYANTTFRPQGVAQTLGSLTDRGRIFMKNGPWDEILRRPMGSPKPYEVWKYSRGRARWYVFLDESGLGNYRLIGSNDRREPGLQNWQSLLTLQENYDDVSRFIGLQGADQQ